MFDICVEDPSGETDKLFVWQNSWGLSTRTIGVMVMVHGDDKGLVMPPMVSQIQVVIIPCGISVKTSEQERSDIYSKATEIEESLKKIGVRAKADNRDIYSPGWKFNQYEMKVRSSGIASEDRASLFALRSDQKILQRENTLRFVATRWKRPLILSIP